MLINNRGEAVSFPGAKPIPLPVFPREELCPTFLSLSLSRCLELSLKLLSRTLFQTLSRTFFSDFDSNLSLSLSLIPYIRLTTQGVFSFNLSHDVRIFTIIA